MGKASFLGKATKWGRLQNGEGFKSTSTYQDIKKYVLQDKELIVEEIKLINPDLIIGGISWESLWYDLFGDALERKNNTIFNWEGIPIIHFYHPSAPGIDNEVLYDKLQSELDKLSKCH